MCLFDRMWGLFGLIAFCIIFVLVLVDNNVCCLSEKGNPEVWEGYSSGVSQETCQKDETIENGNR